MKDSVDGLVAEWATGWLVWSFFADSPLFTGGGEGSGWQYSRASHLLGESRIENREKVVKRATLKIPKMAQNKLLKLFII
jgi:hypothetical protein